jgi:hypothetical protein
MYHSYEIGRERRRELLREAENVRLARRSREVRPRRSSPARGGRSMARLQEMIASWGATNVPFFKA